MQSIEINSHKGVVIILGDFDPNFGGIVCTSQGIRDSAILLLVFSCLVEVAIDVLVVVRSFVIESVRFLPQPECT